LHISNTNINSGLENLPTSIKEIYCEADLKKESIHADNSGSNDYFSCKSISEQLKDYYNKEEKFYNYQDWRLNAQEWLDKEYPKETRKTISKLDISNKDLKGLLSLEDFINLEELECYDNQLTSLDVSRCLKLERLNCYKNQLVNLDISKNSWLVQLVCSENKLTSLNLSEKSQLTELYCFDNLLTELDLSSLNPEKLERLDISDNDFSKQDLSFLSKFINLKYLQVGTYNEEKIKNNIYNRFCGSLESLKDLTKLEELDISNTDVNQGIE